MSEIINKPFKINGIELISFSLRPQQIKEYPKDIFEFTIQQEQKTNTEKKLIIIFTNITVKESGKEAVLTSLQVACGFEISSFETIIKKNKQGDYLIPHDLNTAISRISIATSRGILYSQLRGSYLQNSILPTIPIE